MRMSRIIAGILAQYGGDNMQMAAGTVTGADGTTSISFSPGFVPDMIYLARKLAYNINVGNGIFVSATVFNLSGYFNTLMYRGSGSIVCAVIASVDTGSITFNNYTFTFGVNGTVTASMSGAQTTYGRFDLATSGGVEWLAFKWS